MKDYLRLLRNKNLALIFWGQWVSNLGSNINILGLSWFILSFNGKISDLAILLMFRFLPSVLIGPIAGAIVDRVKKKNIIVISDILQGILSILLIFTKDLSLIYFIVFIQSIISVFFGPAMRSLIPQIVDKSDLPTANALNAISFRVSMLAGPLFGGLILGVTSVKMVFLINGLSFIISAITELFINYEDTSVKRGHIETSLIQDLKEGFTYMVGHQRIRFVIVFFSIMSITGGGWRTLYTSFINLELMSTPQTFGLLTAIMGIGSILGAILVGRLSKSVSSLAIIVYGFMFYAISYLLMGSFSNIIILTGIFFICGTFASFVNVGYDIYLQTYIEPAYMGRVFSLDIAIGNVVFLCSLTLTGILGSYYLPSFLLRSFAWITIVFNIIAIVYYKKNKAKLI